MDFNYQIRTAPKRKQTPHEINPCPACGELQCLCRPRFFAGQLLTEEDLNRLDRYIVEKNKLHNRYLHGWGVVCGLEVLCHPCKGQVTVKSGYAISPCGEDIVVCADDVIDVCALIKKCRDKERREYECLPPTSHPNGCEDAKETWVLAIRYDEKPTRGITALPSSSEAGCCSRCNCGGSSACGCRCHERNNGKTNNGCPKSGPTPAQCEPTMVCEGYRYEVFRAPAADPEKAELGDMLGRMAKCLECLRPLYKLIFAGLGNAPDMQPVELFNLCCQIKMSLETLLMKNPTTNCQMLEDLAAIVCPPPADHARTPYFSMFSETFGRIAVVVTDYLFHCLCSGLLPPCPETADDPRVVLATVTVCKGDCKIVKICNWTTLRKFVTTFPNLQYWLSWLPFERRLRDALEKSCCGKRKIFGFRDRPQSAARSKAVSGLFLDALKGEASSVTADGLVRGIAGVKNEKGEAYLKDSERENLAEFLMLHDGLLPALTDMFPDELQGLFTSSPSEEGKEARPPEEVPAEEIDELKYQMAELKKTLEQQQAKIDQLSKKKPR